jgi:hypothetical protein
MIMIDDIERVKRNIGNGHVNRLGREYLSKSEGDPRRRILEYSQSYEGSNAGGSQRIREFWEFHLANKLSSCGHRSLL